MTELHPLRARLTNLICPFGRLALERGEPDVLRCRRGRRRFVQLIHRVLVSLLADDILHHRRLLPRLPQGLPLALPLLTAAPPARLAAPRRYPRPPA